MQGPFFVVGEHFLGEFSIKYITETLVFGHHISQFANDLSGMIRMQEVLINCDQQIRYQGELAPTIGYVVRTDQLESLVELLVLNVAEFSQLRVMSRFKVLSSLFSSSLFNIIEQVGD